LGEVGTEGGGEEDPGSDLPQICDDFLLPAPISGTEEKLSCKGRILVKERGE